MSDLVGNSEDRFSCVAAQIISLITFCLTKVRKIDKVHYDYNFGKLCVLSTKIYAGGKYKRLKLSWVHSTYQEGDFDVVSSSIFMYHYNIHICSLGLLGNWLGRKCCFWRFLQLLKRAKLFQELRFCIPETAMLKTFVYLNLQA